LQKEVAGHKFEVLDNHVVAKHRKTYAYVFIFSFGLFVSDFSLKHVYFVVVVVLGILFRGATTA